MLWLEISSLPPNPPGGLHAVVAEFENPENLCQLLNIDHG